MTDNEDDISTMEGNCFDDFIPRILSNEDFMMKKRQNPLKICAHSCCRSQTLDNNVNKIIAHYQEERKSSDEVPQVTLVLQSENYQPKDRLSADKSKHRDGVFLYCFDGKLYNQCHPNNSVSLSFINFSNLWLFDRRMADDNTSFKTSCRENSLNDHVTKAAEIWRKFLLNRSREMETGGYLFLRCLTRDDKGQHFGNWTSYNVFSVMAELWRDFYQKDIITQDEVNQVNSEVYFRSEEECISPFKDTSSIVHSSGLRLVDVNTQFTEDFRHELIPEHNHKEHNNKTVFASDMVLFLRRAMQSHFLASLDQNRSTDQKEIILDIFYSRCQALLKSNVPELSFNAYETLIVARKES